MDGGHSAIALDEGETARAAAGVLASLRELGAGAGDRIAVMAETTAEFVAARDAVTALGAAMVPVNPKLTAPEVSYILGHAGARAILAQDDLRSIAAAAAPRGSAVLPLGGCAVAPDKRSAAGTGGREIGATVIYTSGTTGSPKGCVRTEAQELARAEEMIATYGLCEADTHLIACPLAHSAPGILLRACRRAGARTVLMRKFEPRAFLAAAEAHRATVFFLVPTQYERILALPAGELGRYDLSSVRAAIVAGAPIAPRTKERIARRLGPGVLWEFYGSSETGTITVCSPEQQLARPGSVGTPPPGVQVSLLSERGEPVSPGEVGEVAVRSPSVMSGYLEPRQGVLDRSASSPYGVVLGDLGRFDRDGYLYLVDRKHDTIITGGVNVYPAEVERALCEHPDVNAAVVAGVADAAWGQRVAALVARAKGGANADDLRSFLRDRIAPFKIPKQIEFVGPDEVPVGSSGKPLRREAARRLAH